MKFLKMPKPIIFDTKISDISKEVLLELYKIMLKIRKVQLKIEELYHHLGVILREPFASCHSEPKAKNLTLRAGSATEES